MLRKITNVKVIQAIDYILLNLHNQFSVEHVANYCNNSKYHFNRIFREQTGESIYAFVKKLRIETSAFRLGLHTNHSITDIALDYGYSSSNFSTVFAKHMAISPSKLKKLKRENNYDSIHPFSSALLTA
ncbi:helix-turn-helix domain-containing protein [Vibrio hannami]|uniref:helix-turn-helix domain-containing protein n=1 Tax=Vibrio hannami TaxID=2717094 RepID=UPI003BB19E02